MSLVLSEIVDQTQEMLHSDPYLTDARVQNAIGIVKREIHTRTNQMFLKKEGTFATVANQSDYDMSSELSDLDGQKILRIRPPSTTWRAVEYRSYDEFYNVFPQWTGTNYGDPIFYTWEDWQTLRFNPVPNAVATYTVYYMKTVTEIDSDSTDNTELDLPDKYRNVLLDGAVYRCSLIADDERAVLFKGIYDESLGRMCHDLAPSNTGVKPDARMIS